MTGTDLSVALLGIIATVECAQFAVTLDHRGRLAAVETKVERLYRSARHRAGETE